MDKFLHADNKECDCWYESLLGAHVRRYVFSICVSFLREKNIYLKFDIILRVGRWVIELGDEIAGQNVSDNILNTDATAKKKKKKKKKDYTIFHVLS